MKFDFSPSKSLFALPVVRWSAVVLLGMAAITFTIIVFSLREYTWDFSGGGFNNFATFCKVPVGFLAVGFTIIGLCAANHRSEQSREQMRLTAEQNVFANHYKHIEEFEKYCKSRHNNVEEALKIEKALYEKHKSPLFNSLGLSAHLQPTHYRAVYRRVFPRSKVGDFSLSKDYIVSIDGFIDRVCDTFNLFSEPDSTIWPRATVSLYDLVRGYADDHSIELSTVETTKFDFDGERRRIPLGDASLLLAEARDAIQVQVHALSFDVEYSPSEKVNDFLRINLETVPAITPPDFSTLPLQPFSWTTKNAKIGAIFN